MWRNTLRAINCLFAGNFVIDKNGKGGAVAFGSGSAEFINCTFTGNRASEGGAAFGEYPPILHFLNCIFWKNLPEDQAGQLDHCLTNEDPLFVDPKPWRMPGADPRKPSKESIRGGDYSLRSLSPAIDVGSPEGAPLEDIEGKPRPIGQGVDIGCYEFYPGGLFRRGDVNGDGLFQISDAVALISSLFEALPTSCEVSADVNDDEKVDLADAIYLLSYLFANGLEPPPPFETCGYDPTVGDLSCEAQEACSGGS